MDWADEGRFRELQLPSLDSRCSPRSESGETRCKRHGKDGKTVREFIRSKEEFNLIGQEELTRIEVDGAPFL